MTCSFHMVMLVLLLPGSSLSEYAVSELSSHLERHPNYLNQQDAYSRPEFRWIDSSAFSAQTADTWWKELPSNVSSSLKDFSPQPFRSSQVTHGFSKRNKMVVFFATKMSLSQIIIVKNTKFKEKYLTN